jgi:glycerol kinase
MESSIDKILWSKTQADIIQIPVDRPKMRETTALGAAIAAGFAVKVWSSFDELKEINAEGRDIFKPQLSQEKSQKMYKKWTKAVEMCRGWTEDADQNHKE